MHAARKIRSPILAVIGVDIVSTLVPRASARKYAFLKFSGTSMDFPIIINIMQCDNTHCIGLRVGFRNFSKRLQSHAVSITATAKPARLISAILHVETDSRPLVDNSTQTFFNVSFSPISLFQHGLLRLQ